MANHRKNHIRRIEITIASRNIISSHRVTRIHRDIHNHSVTSSRHRGIRSRPVRTIRVPGRGRRMCRIRLHPIPSHRIRRDGMG